MCAKLQQLWKAFRQKPDEETFAPLYERSEGLVYSISIRILRNEEDARDAVQSAYCRLLAIARGLEPVSDIETPDSLVQRIAVREATNLRKRRARRQYREAAMDILQSVEGGGLSADKAASQKEICEKVETIVDTLPDKYRIPIVLHYYQGMGKKQIAKAMGKSRTAISYRIAMGLRKLRPLMMRAGLGDPAVTLAGMLSLGAISLASTPMSASAVFVQANVTLSTAKSVAAATAPYIIGGTVMKAKTAIIGAVVVLGIAGAIGISTFQRSDETESNGEYPVAPENKETLIDDQVTQAAVPASPTPSAPAPAEEPATVVPGADESAPVATRRLNIVVTWSGSGKPVAGATVSAGKPSGRKAVASDSAYEQQVKTDELGQAILADIPADLQSLRVTASHPDAANESANIPLPREHAFVMRLDRGVSIYGTVWGPDGSPAPAAEVRLVDSRRDEEGRGHGAPVLIQQTTADENGAYRFEKLAAFRATLAAQKDQWFSIPNRGGKVIHLEAGREYGPHDIFLKEGATVAGVVRDSLSAEPIPGATVSMRPDPTIADPPKAMTGPDGSYELKGLPAGPSIMLDCSADRYTKGIAIVKPSSSEQEVEQDFSLMRADGSARVWVSNLDGMPLEGALVRLRVRDRQTLEKKTDARGCVEIANFSLLRRCMISVSKEGYVKREFIPLEIEPGMTETELSVALAPAPLRVLTGQVTDSLGAPLGGIEIKIGQERDWKELGEAATGVDGRYRLALNETEGAKYTGRYRVTAGADGWGIQTKYGVCLGTESDPESMDFILEPAHWLDVTVVDQSGASLKAIVSLTSEHSRAVTAYGHGDGWTDDQGRIRLNGLSGPRVGLRVYEYTKRGPGTQQWGVYEVDQAVEIVMKDPPVLKALVLDARSQQPVTEFSVSYIIFGDLGREMSWGVDKSNRTDGRVEIPIPGQTSGRWEIMIESEDYSTLMVAKALPVSAPEEEEVFLLEPVDSQITGVVVDQLTNSPLAGIPVRHVAHGFYHTNPVDWNLLYQSENNLIYGVESTLTSANGSFSFDEPGSARGVLFVWAKGYAGQAILPGRHKDLSDPETGMLRIALGQEASVTGVYAIQGKPQTHRELILELAPTSGSPAQIMRIIKPDALGKFQWNSLPGGTYRLTATQEAYGRKWPVWIRRDIPLGTGVAEYINFEDILGYCSLSGKVIGPDQKPAVGAYVVLTPKFKSENSLLGAFTDTQGRYSFANLPAGQYQLEVKSISWQGAQDLYSRTANVAGIERIDFGPAPPASPEVKSE
jgi:RNA polymerase sigma-70 factor (ECF subfamily)